jgi:hypothetical protein
LAEVGCAALADHLRAAS